MGLWADCGWWMQRREGPAQLVHDGADALISIRLTQLSWKSECREGVGLIIILKSLTHSLSFTLQLLFRPHSIPRDNVKPCGSRNKPGTGLSHTSSILPAYPE